MEIHIESQRVQAEWERWKKHFGDVDPYDSQNTVGIIDVLRSHFLIADYFYGQDYGIGGVGPKDPELLHSAVYRQFTSFGGVEKWPTAFEKAATLVFGIVNDHPFHDANKRTGLLVMLYALHKMGRTPNGVDQKDLENLMVDIAEGSLEKHRRRRELGKKDDADVKFIADYIRRYSRARDSKFYTITYHELDQRLKAFGFYLAHPSGNYIDVCKVEERRRGIFGFGKLEKNEVKVTQIGFPGWKKQVGKGAVASVRKATRLLPEHGIDSTTFYHGADPLNALIQQYEGPLKRLAFR
ncbi:MAG: type II toxin-antitoxin system death-on-curing family toxin [Porticoccaceae bacterium]